MQDLPSLEHLAQFLRVHWGWRGGRSGGDRRERDTSGGGGDARATAAARQRSASPVSPARAQISTSHSCLTVLRPAAGAGRGGRGEGLPAGWADRAQLDRLAGSGVAHHALQVPSRPQPRAAGRRKGPRRGGPSLPLSRGVAGWPSAGCSCVHTIGQVSRTWLPHSQRVHLAPLGVQARCAAAPARRARPEQTAAGSRWSLQAHACVQTCWGVTPPCTGRHCSSAPPPPPPRAGGGRTLPPPPPPLLLLLVAAFPSRCIQVR